MSLIAGQGMRQEPCTYGMMDWEQGTEQGGLALAPEGGTVNMGTGVSVTSRAGKSELIFLDISCMIPNLGCPSLNCTKKGNFGPEMAIFSTEKEKIEEKG